MNLSVDIGLLWDELQIRGELTGEHLVRCRVDCCRFLALENTAGEFAAMAEPGRRQNHYAIRLAESLSPEHAESVLSVCDELTERFDVDIVEAGRTWKTEPQTFDNRVWWPIIKLAAESDAPRVLDELRTMRNVDPLGLTVVRLDTATPDLPFEFRLGDFSAKVLEVWTTPLTDDAQFRLHDVPIGRGFHWQRKESLAYRGRLRLFHNGGPGLTAVNQIGLENYLESAVGSEMRSDLPPAFSQAQAIAARSTVLATAGRHHRADGFDLCNDDHCQCYQGIAREADAVIAPLRESANTILIYPPQSPRKQGDENISPRKQGEERRVVDARYAKSCGGVSERYAAVWGGEGPDYFAVRACGEFAVPDLTDERQARKFLETAPPAWCDGQQHPYPAPWDNDPLYRWRFEYDRKQLGELVAEKTGNEVGAVRELRAVRRGESGRILILDIVGEANTLRVYGELNIRRALSKSHLPSSFFVTEDRGEKIAMIGGGWGHGVGLCQLGAAAMAKAGWSVERILAHYYPNSEIGRINQK